MCTPPSIIIATKHTRPPTVFVKSHFTKRGRHATQSCKMTSSLKAVIGLAFAAPLQKCGNRHFWTQILRICDALQGHCNNELPATTRGRRVEWAQNWLKSAFSLREKVKSPTATSVRSFAANHF